MPLSSVRKSRLYGCIGHDGSWSVFLSGPAYILSGAGLLLMLSIGGDAICTRGSSANKSLLAVRTKSPMDDMTNVALVVNMLAVRCA